MRLDHLLSKENYLLFNFEGSLKKLLKNVLTKFDTECIIKYVENDMGV